MKKVSELTGVDLDSWVLRAVSPSKDRSRRDGWAIRYVNDWSYHPSTDWNIGGLIIEREKISVFIGEDGNWWASTDPEVDDDGVFFDCFKNTHTGETPLIAAMRAYVSSVYGEHVNV